MALDLSKPAPNSPLWWMRRQLLRLEARKPVYQELWNYYEGSQPLPRTTSKELRDAYRRMMRMSRTNYAELVIEAVRERLLPDGFRTGAERDPSGDSEAWRVWQANGLDADCDLVHRPYLAMGAAFVLVGPMDEEIEAPVITPEDPRQVTAELDPVKRRRVVAALKQFADEAAGQERAYLYLPGEVHRLARELPKEGTTRSALVGWSQDGAPQALPAELGGRVPVVPFLNRPDGEGCTTSELSGHLGLLDRITYTVLNRLEITTLQAFRQRAVKGVPDRDAEGMEIDYDDIFSMDPAALWVLPEGADIWESGQADLTGIRASVRDDVQDLAAVTRTPLFYLTPDAADSSAEGAALAREGLVFKCWDRLRALSDPWEAVMSLAFAYAGDEARARRADMEVLWKSPERYSLGEKADAAAKGIAGGLTWEQVQESIWQVSPQELDHRREEHLAEAAGAPGEPVEVEAEAAPAALEAPNAAEELRQKAEALGVLIRAGVEPEDAAVAVGLAAMRFTGAVPVTLRLPEAQAEELEPGSGAG